MKIVQAPNEVLANPSQRVEKIDKYTHNLLKDMEQALLAASDPEGVGLAAPQIGKGLQIFIVKETPDAEIKTFINPVIESFKDTPKKIPVKKPKTKIKSKKRVQLEGCLSLKDIWGVVKRHDEVVLSYQDETGTQHKKTFEGFMSVIIQHEYDHLQGVLFPKRVLEQKNKLFKSVKNKKGETEFEELEI